ncbi:MAG: hypothetical protein WC460_02470 [Patescibacteria group bacterium]
MVSIGFQHPELQEGEVYLDHIFPSTFKNVGWKTKRLGKVAYNKLTGQEIPKRFNRLPLFAQRTEVAAAGVNPDTNLDLMIKTALELAGREN